MPDIWTHYFFARQVMYEQQLTIDHLDWYYFGAQGPDFLFYQGFQPWKKQAKPGTEVAKELHQVRTDKLLRFVLACRKEATGELKDYLTGFLSHYALDATVHPMIHRDATDGKDHKQLEMALDMKLYHERRGRPITEASVPRVMARKRRLPKPIVDFYIDLTSEVFEHPAEGELFEQSYEDFRKFHKYTSLKSTMKKGMIETTLKKTGLDYTHYFYGEETSQRPIPQQQYDEFIDRFLQARDVFRVLNRSELPEEVVNFSGYSLETSGILED